MTRFTPIPLYAILDAETCARRGLAVWRVAEIWRDAGIRLLQYRDKQGSDEAVLRNARAIRDIFGGSGATLILNDRVPLFAASGFDGVHVGQGDMPVSVVRRLIGAEAVLGISTHNPGQLGAAALLDVDYVAVGPVFLTGTKLDADPVIGLEGVRTARALTSKPLVAIGGIGLPQAPLVRAAGADSIALISALLPDGVDDADSLRDTVEDFLRALQ